MARIGENTVLLLSDKSEVSDTSEGYNKKLIFLLFCIVILAYVYWLLVAW